MLNRMDMQRAVFGVKRHTEEQLCRALNLEMVQVPLIVDRASGVNVYLDRNGSSALVKFPCGVGLSEPIQAQVVQAATKWKRMALVKFECKPGGGHLHGHARC